MGRVVIAWEMDFVDLLVHESTPGSNLFAEMLISKNSK